VFPYWRDYSSRANHSGLTLARGKKPGWLQHHEEIEDNNITSKINSHSGCMPYRFCSNDGVAAKESTKFEAPRLDIERSTKSFQYKSFNQALVETAYSKQTNEQRIRCAVESRECCFMSPSLSRY
jgi:hypothetical protein